MNASSSLPALRVLCPALRTSLLAVAALVVLFASPAQAQVVINEIMQNPSAVSDDDGEWFELYNPTASPVDVNGWTVRDNDNDSFVIVHGGPLLVPAGGYLVLGNQLDPAINGGITVQYQFSDMVLANSSDELVLFDDSMTEVDRVEWDDGTTFPDPNGESMELARDPGLDNNAGASWCDGYLRFGDGDHGTPGEANTCCFSEACMYLEVDVSTRALARATLHQAIDDHVRFPYTSTATDTWDILEFADEELGDSNRILDLYRNASYPKAGGDNDDYDREHSWPKSFGFPENSDTGRSPYRDCHHLFLADLVYNEQGRRNNPYRDCTDPACEEWTTEVNDGQGGAGESNWKLGFGSTGTWETWPGRRGDVARAILYMDVRYEGGTHGATAEDEPDLIVTDNEALVDASNTGNNESVAYMGMLAVLLQWHAQDPVDSREQWRNEAVFSFQGNRNPFIDHPEWVRCVYLEDCGDTPIDISPCDPANPAQLCLLDGRYAVTARFMRSGEWNPASVMTVLDDQGEPSQKTGGMAFGDPQTMSISVAVRPACSGGYSADWAAVGSMDLAQWELTIRRVADGVLWTKAQDLGGNTSEIDRQAFACP